MRIIRIVAIGVLCLLLAAGVVRAETDTIVLLHTNDMHDHLRADPTGIGGMAYLASYIRAAKAARPDVLVLDAGDVMEKGDLFAFLAKSAPMYEAMERIGFDAGAPGNHDDAYGAAHLSALDAATPHFDVLCINWFHPDGTLIFPASRIFDVDGVRVGVIGMIRPRDEYSLDLEASALAIRDEAQRLEGECDLIVVTCHAGPRDCERMAEVAPEVDVFVSGHTHQALFEPQTAPGSGALIVQAGHYTKYVGRLELTVDLDTDRIVAHEGRLIAMDHAEIVPDAEIAEWVATLEREIAPNAAEPIGVAPEVVGAIDLARIAAEGYREAAGADIGFCHPGQILRAQLAAGPYDRNAIFHTGGQRGYAVVETDVLGADIEAYLNGLARGTWGMTVWSGFRAGRDRETRRYTTGLDSARTYRVVMPEKEWDTRFKRYFEEKHAPASTSEAARLEALQSRPVETSFTEAVIAYIRAHGLENADLNQTGEQLAGRYAL